MSSKKQAHVFSSSNKFQGYVTSHAICTFCSVWACAKRQIRPSLSNWVRSWMRLHLLAGQTTEKPTRVCQIWTRVVCCFLKFCDSHWLAKGICMCLHVFRETGSVAQRPMEASNGASCGGSGSHLGVLCLSGSGQMVGDTGTNPERAGRILHWDLPGSLLGWIPVVHISLVLKVSLRTLNSRKFIGPPNSTDFLNSRSRRNIISILNLSLLLIKGHRFTKLLWFPEYAHQFYIQSMWAEGFRIERSRCFSIVRASWAFQPTALSLLGRSCPTQNVSAHSSGATHKLTSVKYRSSPDTFRSHTHVVTITDDNNVEQN